MSRYHFLLSMNFQAIKIFVSLDQCILEEYRNTHLIRTVQYNVLLRSILYCITFYKSYLCPFATVHAFEFYAFTSKKRLLMRYIL